MTLFQTSTEPSLVIDPSLESNVAGSCTLIIASTENTVQLSLVERKSLKVLALEKMRLDQSVDMTYVDRIRSGSQLIKKFAYSGVRWIVFSRHYTFVPEALFRTGDEYKFYRLNFHNDISSVVLVGHVPKFGMYCLYGVNAGLADHVRSAFPDCRITHFSEVLLNNRFLSSGAAASAMIQLNVRDQVLDILVTEGKRLLLMNTFAWHTIEDVLYYTLFTAEQLGLNPGQNKLVLSGAVEKASALYKLLDTYFSSISFDELPGLKPGYGMEEIPFHQNTVIYGSSLCE